jgi:hypothetical protein
MRRLILGIAVAAAVAFIVVAYRTRALQDEQDEEAVDTWENEGGAAPAEGLADG